MRVKVNFYYPHLKALVNNQDSVEVQGNTIGNCLHNLVSRFPDIQSRIFDNQLQLLNFIVIFHNGETTYYEPDPLAKPVDDGDELSIVLLMAGG
jgi:molybdopterin converting factor small subunit